MLALGPQTAVFIAVTPVDFRLGIDGLARRCHSVLFQQPMSGAVFVFRNRQRTAVKLIHYDGQGFILFHKRCVAHLFIIVFFTKLSVVGFFKK